MGVILFRFLTGQMRKRLRTSSVSLLSYLCRQLTLLVAKSGPEAELWDSQGLNQQTTISLTDSTGIPILGHALSPQKPSMVGRAATSTWGNWGQGAAFRRLPHETVQLVGYFFHFRKVQWWVLSPTEPDLLSPRLFPNRKSASPDPGPMMQCLPCWNTSHSPSPRVSHHSPGTNCVNLEIALGS